jgi:protein-S-isoprenylcysteine O-methyltransferase Ste14
VSFWIIIVYFVIWAGVHSFLASRKAKTWAKGVFGPGVRRWYRFAFVAFAVLTLAPLAALMAFLSDRLVYSVASPWRWLMTTGQVVSFGFLIWSVMETRPMDFIGVSRLIGKTRKGKPKLMESGLYGLVRHPMYFFSLLIMWLSPSMTVNRLTLYGLISLYFFVGTYHEEILLEGEFGQGYADYRKRVPRLIPFLRFRRPVSGEPDVRPLGGEES